MQNVGSPIRSVISEHSGRDQTHGTQQGEQQQQQQQQVAHTRHWQQQQQQPSAQQQLGPACQEALVAEDYNLLLPLDMPLLEDLLLSPNPGRREDALLQKHNHHNHHQQQHRQQQAATWQAQQPPWLPPPALLQQQACPLLVADQQLSPQWPPSTPFKAEPADVGGRNAGPSQAQGLPQTVLAAADPMDRATPALLQLVGSKRGRASVAAAAPPAAAADVPSHTLRPELLSGARDVTLARDQCQPQCSGGPSGSAGISFLQQQQQQQGPLQLLLDPHRAAGLDRSDSVAEQVRPSAVMSLQGRQPLVYARSQSELLSNPVAGGGSSSGSGSSSHSAVQQLTAVLRRLTPSELPLLRRAVRQEQQLARQQAPPLPHVQGTLEHRASGTTLSAAAAAGAAAAASCSGGSVGALHMLSGKHPQDSSDDSSSSSTNDVQRLTAVLRRLPTSSIPVLLTALQQLQAEIEQQQQPVMLAPQLSISNNSLSLQAQGPLQVPQQPVMQHQQVLSRTCSLVQPRQQPLLASAAALGADLDVLARQHFQHTVPAAPFTQPSARFEPEVHVQKRHAAQSTSTDTAPTAAAGGGRGAGWVNSPVSISSAGLPAATAAASGLQGLLFSPAGSSAAAAVQGQALGRAENL